MFVDAVISSVTGLISVAVGKWFIEDKLARRNMRRLLYRDLAQNFFTVDRFMRLEPSEITTPASGDPLLWQQEQFRKFISFSGEKASSENPLVYIQLSERFAGKTLYRRLHLILEDPVAALPLNTNLAISTFANYVHEGVLNRKYFNRFLDRDIAQELLCRVDDYNGLSGKGVRLSAW